MTGVALVITSALLVGLCALVLLLWALANGQYDDMQGDAERILIDDDSSSVMTGCHLLPRSEEMHQRNDDNKQYQRIDAESVAGPG